MAAGALTQRDRRRLARALTELPEMLKGEIRQVLVDQLRGELGESFSPARHDTPQFDLLSIVEACTAYDRGVPVLRDMVAEFYGEHPRAQTFLELVGMLLPEPWLGDGERAELLRTLVGVPPRLVAAAFHAATHAVTATDDLSWGDLGGVVGRLESHGVGGDPAPPLLAFADRLAHEHPGPLDRSLHGWVDRVGRRLGLRQADLLNLCGQVEQLRARRYFAVVQIVPDRFRDDRYQLAIVLQADDHREETLRRDNRARSLAEIARELDTVLHQVPNFAGVEFAELTVEFFLPRSLLAHPVDQFASERPDLPSPLGIRHPVVIRDLERAQRRTARRDWLRRWARVARAAEWGEEQVVEWIDAARPHRADWLYSRLAADEGKVCLGLGFLPDAVADRFDELAAGLHAGIPVIVICREAGRDDVRGEVDRLVAEAGVAGLPRAILRLRQAAVAREDASQPATGPLSAGQCLSLVFDDAERVPQAIATNPPLQAPTELEATA